MGKIVDDRFDLFAGCGRGDNGVGRCSRCPACVIINDVDLNFIKTRAVAM
jgi:hypothetical protein